MHAYRDQYATLFHGGRDIVLIGISTDTPEALGSWARDDEFPFLFASDPGSEVGQQFGAFREMRDGGLIDNRTLFVIDPEGRIAWRAVPFREVDPTAYVELGDVLDRIASISEEDERQ
jgi:peroxiredoxin